MLIQLLERDNKIQMLWSNILIAVLILVGILSVALYYLQHYRDRRNRLILNLEIEQLTSQNQELSEKYKSVLTSEMKNLSNPLTNVLLKGQLKLLRVI